MVPKSRLQIVLRNAAFVTVANGVSQVLLAITGIAIVRYLGLSLYSDYATAMLYMSLFSVLGRLGFHRVFLRECSRDVDLTPHYFAATLLLNGGLAFLGWVAALYIAYFRYDSRVFALTVLLGTSLMLMSLRRTSTTVFQVHQKMHFTALVSIVGSLFYTIVFFAAMVSKASIFVLAGLHLIMSVFNFLLSCGLSFRLSFPRFHRPILKKLLSFGWYFCAIDIMLVAYTQSNGFILAVFNLKEQVGIYNAAFRMFALLQMIGQVIESAIAPALYGASNEPERMLRGIKLAIRYFTVGGILLGAIFLGRAEWLMTTVFKAEFAASANVLMLLGVTIGCRFPVILLSHIIYAMNKEQFMLAVTACLTAFSVVSFLILVPLYGTIAAAAILLVSEGAMALVCLIQVERLLGKVGLWKLFVLPILSGATTLVVLRVSGGQSVSGLLVSPLVFFGFLWLAGYYRITEVVFLAKMLVRSR